MISILAFIAGAFLGAVVMFVYKTRKTANLEIEVRFLRKFIDQHLAELINELSRKRTDKLNTKRRDNNGGNN